MRHASKRSMLPADRVITTSRGVAVAPAWFEAALADVPERNIVRVEDANIETLAWGARGLPGLLMLHGFSAHADWWSFVAPLLRSGRRVVAMSFSGMGRSDRRESYALEQ